MLYDQNNHDERVDAYENFNPENSENPSNNNPDNYNPESGSIDGEFVNKKFSSDSKSKNMHRIVCLLQQFVIKKGFDEK